MKYGYIRVSTRQQRNKGNSLEAQMEAVRAADRPEIVEAHPDRRRRDGPTGRLQRAAARREKTKLHPEADLSRRLRADGEGHEKG